MTKRPDRIRKPQQDRSRETLTRMFDAAERLMAERPFEKVTVQQIVKEAGTTTGAFYTRFTDKDALLEAMHAQHVADTVAHLKDALTRITGPARFEHVELIVGMIGAVFRLRPALMRSGTLKYWNAAAGEVRTASQSAEHAAFAKQIKQLRKELETIAASYGNPHAREASHFALKIALAASRQHYLFTDERTILKTTDRAFERELAAMVHYYLKNGEIRE
jgi:AcrR family transcriptional regulator